MVDVAVGRVLLLSTVAVTARIHQTYSVIFILLRFFVGMVGVEHLQEEEEEVSRRGGGCQYVPEIKLLNR